MTDLLSYVRGELLRRQGEITTIARESGVSYDVCLRIKRGENDPRYSNVERLAGYLRKRGEIAAA